ncbi:protein Brevis radix-like 3 [Impatiens glandulifera]|uniref:protein Brevis radix-like 3 n=1 Tax=Impatiens glandulifera TaxID=253017 RepID=UPI001FB114D3|nr:protein Brevis radix-like 3 [Impatiens glandulifera]XP_047327600.1 protein Brevis radix-like 3 [Impatiens glandulifera]
MLTCIACSKQQQHIGNGSRTHQDTEEADTASTPRTKQAIKALTAQIKDIALKASGAYKHCKPCSGSSNRNNQNKNEYAGSDSASLSEKFHCSYQRAGTAISTPMMWKKDMEARLKDLSSAEGTPSTASISGRTDSALFIEEDEVKEWVAQVEPGVLITFVSRPQGGNDLKRIRFSREMFNKCRAQKWWTDNYDKVMELYNVHERLNEQEETPSATPQRSDNESSKIESDKKGGLVVTSPSPIHSCCVHNTGISPRTPSHPNTNARKLDDDGSSSIRRSSSSRGDGDDHRSISNASDMETEWVEQDEPGVYITIRALPDGTKELRRVRFSRERFGEMHARLWWEQNRARIQEQYL